MSSIPQNLKILDTINLVEVDHDPTVIYQRLLQNKKNVFQPNEKIVIIHKDTEYFYFDHPTGFSIYNLFSVWRDLDIPYSVMILCSTYHDLNRAISPFIVNAEDRPTVISSLLNHQSHDSLENQFPGTDYKDIQYPAVCLLGRARAHRIKILQFLIQHNLLGLVKTNFNSNSYQDQYTVKDMPISMDANFSKLAKGMSTAVYSQPHRYNHSGFSQSLYKEIVDLNQWPVTSMSNPDLSANFYQNAFLEIVSESFMECPHCFLSEKIFKPMIHKTPFIFFGTPYSLKQLHNHGFKTFSDFWAEDYDNESNHHLRFLKCCHTMQELVTRPLDELILIYQNMQDILTHNRNRLIEYIEKEYKPLHKQIGI